MKKKSIIFIVTLVILVALPEGVSSRMRGAVASGLIPGGRGREARVVYRSPATWSSTLWINVGSSSGVVKDSPVVWNGSLVGVIDEVGRKQSRVRLITDSGLTPSVRVLRGRDAARALLWHIESLELGMGPEAEELLATLQESINLEEENKYLAKGELRGSGEPLWRGSGNVLQGIGFNYDHADEYGSGRDLRTGEPFDGGAPIPIVQKGDLLVTTGMDGVFPAGLHVARVTEVEMLREGAYFYKLKARPTAGDMNEITRATILPPQTP